MRNGISRRHFTLGLTAIGALSTASVIGNKRALADDTGSGILCFVGGYTKHGPPNSEGNGTGISVFEMDRETGLLTLITNFTDIASPSFITLSKDSRFLYALSEIDDFNKEGHGCVTAFSVDKRTGTLVKLNSVSSGGAIPAHLSVHPSGKYVLVANYVGGSVGVLPIKDDGSLGDATDVVHNSGPRQPDRAADNPPGNFAVSDHSGPHPHMVDTDPSGRYVIVNDAGLDRVYISTLDLKSGKLIPAKTPYFDMTPGSAPRHFVFDHSGRIMYNLCEQDSKVNVCQFNPSTGALSVVQTVSTVSSHFKGSTLAAEILLSGDGKHVYVSNRLGDSLAVFDVGQDGTLVQKDQVWMHADYGRAMMFDPSGNFLFCANQRSDAVTSFRVDRDRGTLLFTNHFTAVGSPTSFAFLTRDT